MSSTGPEATTKSVDDFLRESVPNWDVIDFEVHCSRCGYNLRTLTNPRCPECGFQFEWRALIEGYLHRNIYLFEHMWRKKPIRGYLKALWQPLFRPKKFWKRISLHDRVETSPLWAMLPLAVVSSLIFAHGAAMVLSAICTAGFNSGLIPRPRQYYASFLQGTPPSQFVSEQSGRTIEKIEIMAWTLAAVPYEDTMEWIILPFGMILVLVSILGIASTLHETIAKFKLRRAHLLRVVAYSSGPAFSLFGTTVIVAPILLVCLKPSYRSEWVVYYQMGMVVLASLFFMNQLRSGFRNYLGIPHAALASLLFTIVGVLASAAIILFIAAIIQAIF